ncbi:MAG: four helix bundle protein [Terriglobales bacterium]
MATASTPEKRHYKDLLVWQKSLAVVRDIYKLTGRFPGTERYGLADQMRRAAVSIPRNIAEGQAHHSTREFLHFLHHARGSLAELNTQMLIAMDLGYVPKETGEPLLKRIEEISRMLNGLISSITPD